MSASSVLAFAATSTVANDEEACLAAAVVVVAAAAAVADPEENGRLALALSREKADADEGAVVAADAADVAAAAADAADVADDAVDEVEADDVRGCCDCGQACRLEGPSRKELGFKTKRKREEECWIRCATRLSGSQL